MVSDGLRNRCSGKKGWTSPLKQREGESSFLCLCILLGPSAGCIGDASMLLMVDSLASVYQITCQSLLGIPRNNGLHVVARWLRHRPCVFGFLHQPRLSLRSRSAAGGSSVTGTRTPCLEVRLLVRGPVGVRAVPALALWPCGDWQRPRFSPLAQAISEFPEGMPDPLKG